VIAPTVEHLQYRDPHPQKPGRHRPSGWAWDGILGILLRSGGDTRNRSDYRWEHYCPAFDPCDICADWDRQKAILGEGFFPVGSHPGWHGPLPAALHAEHITREHTEAEQQQAAHIAELALNTRRTANLMWRQIKEAMPHEGSDRDVDAVMDAVYGEGRW
jgi:hypothetical protein